MITIKAEQKHSRQSPRKVRLVAAAVRGLKIDQAVAQLSVIEKKGSVVLLNVLRQAIANATNNLGLKTADLEIKEIIVNKGPSYKRFRAASRGRASTLLKPTCHVKVVLQSNVEPTLKQANAKSNTQPKKAVESSKSVEMKDSERKSIKPESAATSKVQQARVSNKAASQSAARRVVNRTTSK